MHVYTYCVCTCACKYILPPRPFESSTGSTSRLVRLINIYDFEEHFIDMVSSKSTTFHETLCSYIERLVGMHMYTYVRMYILCNSQYRPCLAMKNPIKLHKCRTASVVCVCVCVCVCVRMYQKSYFNWETNSQWLLQRHPECMCVCARVCTYIFGHMLGIFITDTVPAFLSQITLTTDKDDGCIWTIVAYFWEPPVPNILKGVVVGYIKTDKKDICLGIGEWAEPIIVLLTS